MGKHNNTTCPFITLKGQECICQAADSNKDGIWDSLFIEVTLAPYATDTLSLQWIAVPPGNYPKTTNIRFSLRSADGQPQREITDTFRKRGFEQNISQPVYQMEGPGIENDKVAFRIFFDKRNGKDIYGKLTTTPVLDIVGLNGNWHHLQDWGMDILKTGRSMGAGAFAVKANGKIWPLADADSTVFTQLYEGPLAAAFRLDFYNRDAGGTLQQGSEVITMLKGNYFYTTTLYLPLSQEQKLLQGFAHFYSDSMRIVAHNKRYTSILTYGTQAEGDISPLGLAIMVPQQNFLSADTTLSTDQFPNSCYAELSTAHNISTRFFACWARTESRFENKAGFTGYLQEVADKLAHPIHVTMSKKYK